MVGTKLLLLVAVLASGALGGAIALRRGSAASGGRLLDRGNSFAAGVFLGAGFVHMLPDASEAWASLGWHYPMGFLIAAVAFALLLLFEHVLLPDDAHHAVHASSAERFAPLESTVRGGLAAYAVLTALSTHSFVAGLALGTEMEFGRAIVIFLAIASHKSVEGFALGVSLARSSLPPERAWRLLAVFALATPVGILAGTFLDVALEGTVERGLQASCLALAAGTFVYVATLDILRDEFLEPGGRWAKWGWVSAGIVLMSLLAVRC